MNHLLFDLDGTLTDPRDGILRCITYALESLKIAVPPERELLWCIGPPLQRSFKKLLGNEREHLSDQALKHYRERFETKGMFENKVYSEVPETLQKLIRMRHKLFVATSKPQVFAEKILEHFKLKEFFSAIYGSELDGRRGNKAELIRFILDKESIAPETAIMIGDREHDILGANANSVQTIGVTWGYGSLEELQRAGASRVIDHSSELTQCL